MKTRDDLKVDLFAAMERAEKARLARKIAEAARPRVDEWLEEDAAVAELNAIWTAYNQAAN